MGGGPVSGDLLPKSNASNPVLQAAVQSGSGTSAISIHPAVRPAIHAVVPMPVTEQRWTPVKTSSRNSGIRNEQPVKLQRSGRNYYDLKLTLLPLFERVGPIKISLRRVDWKNQNCDLSILLGDFRIDKRHVKLYEPLWIRLDEKSKPVQLLTDRIGKNYVHGYLCDSRCQKQQVTPAPSQRKAVPASSKHGSAVADSRLGRRRSGA
jgi:hypothetical protein